MIIFCPLNPVNTYKLILYTSCSTNWQIDNVCLCSVHDQTEQTSCDRTDIQ